MTETPASPPEDERTGWLRAKWEHFTRKFIPGGQRPVGGIDGSASNVPSALTPGKGLNARPDLPSGKSGGGTSNEPIPPK